MSDKLTPKNARFVAEYLIDGNATRAAAAVGYSAKSAHVIGARLLRNVKVAAAIADAESRRLARLGITADRVLEEIAKLAYFDPGKLYDEGGNRIPVHRLDPDTRAAVGSVEDETITSPATEKQPEQVTRLQKLKLVDKTRPLELLGRSLKLFTDKVEHGGRLTLEQLVCGDGESGEQADS